MSDEQRPPDERIEGVPARLPDPPPEPPKPPELPVEPAQLPRGLMNGVNYVLQNPRAITESLRRDDDLWKLSRTLLVIIVAMSAIYGFVMGGTNWLQGSPVIWRVDFLMMLVTAIKVPVLFLLTLLIVVPPIYVSSTFVGARGSFSQMCALLLASLAITAITLASMASVAFFFSLTTRSYSFIKVLHVLFFAYAGVAGLIYLVRGFNTIIGPTTSNVRVPLFMAWLVLYMFVGTQLAWVMRPFVGNPGMEFEIFRPRSGNFYENVLESVGDMFAEDPDARRQRRQPVNPAPDPLAFQPHDGFDVGGVGEDIEGYAAGDVPAGLGEGLAVASEGGGVAGNVDEGAGITGTERGDEGLSAFARRVEEHDAPGLVAKGPYHGPLAARAVRAPT
jgi:hypothetical protein